MSKRQSPSPPTSLLLVEGPNDKHVLWALLQHHQLPQSFGIEELGGIEKRLENIETRLKAFRTAEDLPRLGLIIDADDALPQRWRRLQSILRDQTGALLPDGPEPGGTVISIGISRCFGIWAM